MKKVRFQVRITWAALSIQSQEAVKADDRAMKAMTPQMSKYVAKVVEGTADAFTRVGTTVAWSLVAGPYYGATDKKLKSFAYGFDLKNGFTKLDNPESDENSKKLFKSVIDVNLTISPVKLNSNAILNEVAGELISTAKDVAFDYITAPKTIPIKKEQENNPPIMLKSVETMNPTPTPQNDSNQSGGHSTLGERQNKFINFDRKKIND